MSPAGHGPGPAPEGAEGPGPQDPGNGRPRLRLESGQGGQPRPLDHSRPPPRSRGADPPQPADLPGGQRSAAGPGRTAGPAGGLPVPEPAPPRLACTPPPSRPTRSWPRTCRPDTVTTPPAPRPWPAAGAARTGPGSASRSGPAGASRPASGCCSISPPGRKGWRPPGRGIALRRRKCWRVGVRTPISPGCATRPPWRDCLQPNARNAALSGATLMPSSRVPGIPNRPPGKSHAVFQESDPSALSHWPELSDLPGRFPAGIAEGRPCRRGAVLLPLFARKLSSS